MLKDLSVWAVNAQMYTKNHMELNLPKNSFLKGCLILTWKPDRPGAKWVEVRNREQPQSVLSPQLCERP